MAVLPYVLAARGPGPGALSVVTEIIAGTNITITSGDGLGHGPITINSSGGGGGGSPLTTKGDLFTHGTVDARLPIGTDGFVLNADSAQTLGLGWSTRNLNVNGFKVTNMANGSAATDAVAYEQLSYALLQMWR